MSKALKRFAFIIGALLLIAMVGLSYSQEKKKIYSEKQVTVKGAELQTERRVVKFSDPSKPGLLEVDLFRGEITVRGYSGKEVIIEAKIAPMKRIKRREDEDAELEERYRREKREFAEFKEFEEQESQLEETRRKSKRKTEGMKKIHSALAGLEIIEENNIMTVDVESLLYHVDLIIQVPFNTSLKLNGGMEGNIKVEQVSGEVEVDSTNGAITLNNISGPVVAHSFSRDIVATFTKVKPGKPMSFSSMSGHIDVTLPPNVKSTLKMQTNQGEIYSDFDIRLEQRTKKSEEDRREKGGKYRLRLESFLYGTINGGGVEIQFETFTGDIYIRKGKYKTGIPLP